jgi:hypothetical protein
MLLDLVFESDDSSDEYEFSLNDLDYEDLYSLDFDHLDTDSLDLEFDLDFDFTILGLDLLLEL